MLLRLVKQSVTPALPSVLRHLSMRQIIGLVVLGTATFGTSLESQAQAIPESANSLRTTVDRSELDRTADRQLQQRKRLPNPVRQADHTEPLVVAQESVPNRGHANQDSESSVQGSGWSMGHRQAMTGLPYSPQHTHRILRPPSTQLPTGHSHDRKSRLESEFDKRWIHPPFSSHRRRIQPAPAMVPDGKQRAIWKSPYSYGYFGATRTRHWSLHYGYRDRYTEWRLK